MKRRLGTIFDYSVTDPRTRFSRRKNHDPDQKTEQKITTSSSKKVVQNPEEEIKRANRFSQENMSKKSSIL